MPALTYIIPCRDTSRLSAIQTVVANIRAQRFPQIQIVIAEHDVTSHIPATIEPVTYKLIKSGTDLFNKSKAFNAGVALAEYPYLVLHDADMLAVGSYTETIYRTLNQYDACHLGNTVIYTNKDGANRAIQLNKIDSSIACDHMVGYFEGGSIACRRATYWLVGGFNEDFKGYGWEDVDFYARLSTNCNWSSNRTFDFLHLWHPRTTGWTLHHARNKIIGGKLNKLSMSRRITEQYGKLIAGGYGKFLVAAQAGQL